MYQYSFSRTDSSARGSIGKLATGFPNSTNVPASTFPTKQVQIIENNSTPIDRKPSRIEVSGHSSIDNTSTKDSVTIVDKRQDIVGSFVARESMTSSIARETMTKVEKEERQV